jgi:hypothetical protein
VVARAGQQPGFRQQESGGAHGGQHRALRMLPAQPIGVTAEARQGFAQREQKAGHQHQVRMLDLVQRQFRLQGLAAQRAHRLPSSEAVTTSKIGSPANRLAAVSSSSAVVALEAEHWSANSKVRCMARGWQKSHGISHFCTYLTRTASL